MNTTVVLCTYNRCESLAKALASTACLQLPGSVDWEVLVVDNNSSDRTREVAEEYCRRSPGHFRYLFEPRQGKSHALNTGIREARGDVIAFIERLDARPVDLMGHSRGGHISFRVAQRRPDLLRRLILAEPGGELDATLDPDFTGGPSPLLAHFTAAADKIAVF